MNAATNNVQNIWLHRTPELRCGFVLNIIGPATVRRVNCV
jgi:hypothetical protein